MGFIKLFKNDPRFRIEVVALIAAIGVLLIYIGQLKAMRDSVKVARDANKLTEDSVRARLLLSDFDVARPVAGHHIVANLHLKNVGHSLAIYGLEVAAIDGYQLPDGDIPLAVKDVSVPLQPDVRVDQSIVDQTIADQAFIDNLPVPSELTRDPSTHHAQEPTKKPTIFFFGRLIYESLGKRREQQFCFFVIRSDATWKEMRPPKIPSGDPDIDFIACSKWNLTHED